MIGKDEILSYVDQAAELEKTMLENYKYLYENLEDSELKSRVEQLMRAEQSHANEYVAEMRRLVEEKG